MSRKPKVNPWYKSNDRPEGPLIPASAKNADLIKEKHRQIVEGACVPFFEKGYHKTTIRDIASSCHMSMGQLYHYISSKDDVLFLIYDHMQQMWGNHLVRCGVEGIQDPLERLKSALHHTLEFTAENRKLFLFVYTETKYLDKRHLRAVLNMDDQNVVAFWRRLLEPLGSMSSVEGSVDFLANLISYLMVFLPLRGWNMDRRRSQEHVGALVRFILSGLGIQEPAP